MLSQYLAEFVIHLIRLAPSLHNATILATAVAVAHAVTGVLDTSDVLLA
jgi:hypothetical protein